MHDPDAVAPFAPDPGPSAAPVGPAPLRLSRAGLGARPTTLRRISAECGLHLRAGAALSAADLAALQPIAAAAAFTACQRAPELVPGLPALPPADLDVSLRIDGDALRLRLDLAAIASVDLDGVALLGAAVGAHALQAALRGAPAAARGLDPAGAALLPAALRSSKGAERDWEERLTPPLRAAVLVMSDSVAAGQKQDRAGATVRERLQATGAVELRDVQVIPDEPELLRERVRLAQQEGLELLITVGGTGLWRRDRTVEAVEALIDRPIPGVMEALRAHGQARTPRAMLSRGVAGMVGDLMVVTLPGSSRGALESCDALLPGLLHAFRMLRDPAHAAHETAYPGGQEPPAR